MVACPFACGEDLTAFSEAIYSHLDRCPSFHSWRNGGGLVGESHASESARYHCYLVWRRNQSAYQLQVRYMYLLLTTVALILLIIVHSPTQIFR